MTSHSSTVTHHDNIGLWIHDSTNVGDEAFWPQYIILTQSGTLSHTCLWGANVSLDRLLEKKQCNRQKDSADLYPLCSAPLAPSNFCFLLFCPLWLPLTSLHFPFPLISSLLVLPSFSFSPLNIFPFDSMLSAHIRLWRPRPPAEQFSRNMATTLETPLAPAHSLRLMSRFFCSIYLPTPPLAEPVQHKRKNKQKSM